MGLGGKERFLSNRRDFLMITAGWSALAARSGYLPACPYRNGAAKFTVKDPSVSNIEHLALRKSAERKIHHGEGRFLNPFTRAKHGNLGACEPRWFMAGPHINPAETAKAFLELNAKHLLIVHWGSFRLGDEPVHYPPLEMRREMEERGMLDRLIHLDHGQTLLYDGSGERRIL